VGLKQAEARAQVKMESSVGAAFGGKSTKFGSSFLENSCTEPMISPAIAPSIMGL
jgi:hypothetical protein